MVRMILIAILLAIPAMAREKEHPQVMWEFTNYLHGTTDEVRDQLNGELERLLARRAEKRADLENIDRSIAALSQSSLETAKKNPEFQKLSAERDAAEKELKEARQSNDRTRQLDASGRFNRARMALTKLESDAGGSQLLADLKKNSREIQLSLKGLEEVIVKTSDWRMELIEGIRYSSKIRGPLSPKTEGMLGQVTCEKILGPKSALFSAEIRWGRGETVGEKEGIQIIRTDKRKVAFLFSDIDTATMQPGQPINIDLHVTVQKTQTLNGKLVYVIQRSPAALDDLMEKLMTLRDKPPPEKPAKPKPATRPAQPSPTKTNEADK